MTRTAHSTSDQLQPATPARSKRPRVPADTPPGAAPGRVLVAEDSLTQGRWLCHVLEPLGHEIELVTDGATALARAIEDPPAIVLADVDMPGLDGFALCQRMKEHPVLRLVPFLMVTQRDRVTDLIRALEVGADNYVTKPLETKSVLGRVGRLLADVEHWQQRGAVQRHRLGIPAAEMLLSLERGQLVEMLMGAAQKLEGELATVAEIGVKLTTIGDLDEALQVLATRSRELSHAALATVTLVEHGAWRVRSVDSDDPALSAASRRHEMVEEVPTRLIEKLSAGETVHRKHDSDAWPYGFGIRDTYGYPMIVEETLVGVLSLSFAARRRFASDERRRFQVLANHGAVAILNAQQRQAEKRLREELEAALHAEKEAHKNAMFMLAAAVETRDGLTGSHLRRVQRYAEAIARELGRPEEEIEELSYSSVMHDVGKLLVPDAVLGKPGKLTDDEWDEMRRHPEYGAQILEGRDFFRMACSIALCHHERWDGTGYPRRLKGEEIPLAARITSVADVFDALTTERPYKDAWTDEAALAEIRELSGRSFDPAVAEAFVRLHESGEIGRIRGESYEDVR